MARSARVSVEVAADARASLGEAPCWDERSQTLLFVDVNTGVVFRFDPTGDVLSSFPVGQEVGAAIPRLGGGLVLAVRDGIAVASDAGEGFRLELPIELETAENRMNDAKCDPAGRLFAGTVAFDETPRAAALYRVEADWSFEKVVQDATISNGMGWSPDGSEMYYIDSAAGVDVFDYDAGTGSIGNRRPLATVRPPNSVPDGMTVDEDGNLWVVFYGGGTVRCYSPGGELLDEIEFPASQVTSCTFGGPDLGDLYVTSATQGLRPEQLELQRHAGAVFVCRPGRTGTPASLFAG